LGGEVVWGRKRKESLWLRDGMMPHDEVERKYVLVGVFTQENFSPGFF
jgi:hypothetical protein